MAVTSIVRDVEALIEEHWADQGHWTAWVERENERIEPEPYRDRVTKHMETEAWYRTQFSEAQKEEWEALYANPLRTTEPVQDQAAVFAYFKERATIFDDFGEDTVRGMYEGWQREDAESAQAEVAINSRMDNLELSYGIILETLYRMNAEVWRSEDGAGQRLPTATRTWRVRRNALNAMHLLNNPERTDAPGKANRLARLILAANSRIPVFETGAQSRLLEADFRVLSNPISQGDIRGLQALDPGNTTAGVARASLMSSTELFLGVTTYLLKNTLVRVILVCAFAYFAGGFVFSTLPTYANWALSSILTYVASPFIALIPVWAAEAISTVASAVVTIWAYSIPLFFLGLGLRLAVHWAGFNNRFTRGVTQVGSYMQRPLNMQVLFLVGQLVATGGLVAVMYTGVEELGRSATRASRLLAGRERLNVADRILSLYIHDVAVAPYQTAEV